MPDISSIGPGSVGPINRPAGPDASQRRTDSADTTARRNDRVELSDHARLLDQLRELPNVRQDLVQQIRDAIAKGQYETPEKIDRALESLFADLGE
jgi:flagellar biosynthesis anti-sigma factor FlgM